MMTAGLPFFAACHHKVRAIGRKSPAIVEGPHQLGLRFPEVCHQHFQITIMTMKVVQMNHIRFDPLQLPDQFLRRDPGIEAVITQNTGTQGLPLRKRLRAFYPQRVIGTAGIVQYVVFDPPGSKNLADPNADFSRTAITADRIDLDNLHKNSSLTSINFAGNSRCPPHAPWRH